MTLIRLCRSRYSPKDATGSRLHGGRWNSPGRAVLYASSTLALACLEVLVHIRNTNLMPRDYVHCEIEVPDTLIYPWKLTGEVALARIESAVLSREFGDRWIASTTLLPNRWEDYLRSLPQSERDVLSAIDPAEIGAPVQTVPSVIIPREMNFLINPQHPKFDELVWTKPERFEFDPRLLYGSSE